MATVNNNKIYSGVGYMKHALIIGFMVLFSSHIAISEESHTHDFPDDIMAFHHVMAPLWHLEQGSERVKLTCSSIGKMSDLATKINNSEKLLDTVKALGATCSQKEEAFNNAFKNVHDAFHQVSDTAKN